MQTRVLRSAIRSFSSSRATIQQIYSELGLNFSGVNKGVFDGEWKGKGEILPSYNPTTNEIIGETISGTPEEYEACVKNMEAAKPAWAELPLPVRGEIVRKIGERLRHHKQALGALVSLETGKILSEGLGEVQEAIDICDYALGLSRTLSGQVLPSERPGHFMMEKWNPLQGHVGIITAFNFPCAVFFWNLAISMVCGNTHMWKGSDTTSLISIACTNIVAQTLKHEAKSHPFDFTSVVTLCQGRGKIIGEKMISDPRMELISFTGSTHIGKRVSEVTAGRFGKRILELGGNNAMVILEDADLSLALRAALFAAVGTAGQRCTTLRRVFLHEKIYDQFVSLLVKSYGSVRIGDPLDPATLCGPLHTPQAVKNYSAAVQKAVAAGGKILYGGKVLAEKGGNFVEPTIIEFPQSATQPEVMQEEVFAPILYVMKISNLQEGIRLNNAVSQGLSSALFTSNQKAIFEWTGTQGSDCGIVNVNIGSSGAEIGGAFGGEKATGGGRESGSDSWKQYMRRSTCTINYSGKLPLAQGVRFDV